MQLRTETRRMKQRRESFFACSCDVIYFKSFRAFVFRRSYSRAIAVLRRRASQKRPGLRQRELHRRVATGASLHRYPGSTSSDVRRFLAHGLGAARLHSRDDHQSSRTRSRKYLDDDINIDTRINLCFIICFASLRVFIRRENVICTGPRRARKRTVTFK